MESFEDDALSHAITQSQELQETLLIQYLRVCTACCPACGYNLHRLTKSQCPECGGALRLSIAASHPSLHAWNFLSFSVFCLSGMGVFMAIGMLLHASPFDGPLALSLFVVHLLLNPIVALVILLLQRRILRLRPKVQWMLGAGYLGLTLGLIIAVIFSRL